METYVPQSCATVEVRGQVFWILSSSVTLRDPGIQINFQVCSVATLSTEQPNLHFCSFWDFNLTHVCLFVFLFLNVTSLFFSSCAKHEFGVLPNLALTLSWIPSVWYFEKSYYVTQSGCKVTSMLNPPWSPVLCLLGAKIAALFLAQT